MSYSISIFLFPSLSHIFLSMQLDIQQPRWNTDTQNCLEESHASVLRVGMVGVIIILASFDESNLTFT